MAALDADRPVTLSDTVAEAEWDAFVDSHPQGTSCHAWRWRHIFERVFGHECAYLAARREGAITGVLPLVKFRSRLFGRFLVSLPFVNDGGLLTSDARSSATLIDEAARLAGAFGATHVELRHRARQRPELPCRQHKVGMRMPLAATSEAVWSALDRKVRNQVRKAQKSGLQAVSGGGELVDEFYPVFAENMRDLGTPVYSRRLFDEVLAQFPDRGRVFVVRLSGRTIAGSVALLYRGTFEVPWASSLKEHRQLCPNMLLYWSMIEWAIERRAVAFDFGRSSPNAGTYQFKEQWGARPEPLNWEYLLSGERPLPDHGPGNPRFERAIAAWKRLPLWMTLRLGPSIVRNIP
jgi:FemAB-related protein (PEP-CTERM system-associated)